MTQNLAGLYLIHALSRAIRRRFDELAREYGLTLPQWRVLRQLAKMDELSQATLATLTDTDPMTLSGILDRLEAKGLVQRVPDPGDSRAKLVRTTQKARDMVGEIKGVAHELYEEALQGVSESERDALFATLARIVQNLSSDISVIKEFQQ